MAISVVCSGCKTRFNVSDQFAGRTGPCPKCKKLIKIPQRAAGEVTIQEPEPPTGSPSTTRMPTAPIIFKEDTVSLLSIVSVAIVVLGSLFLSILFRYTWGPGNTPTAILVAGAILFSFPCAWCGYWILRDREIPPLHGTSLATRSLICAVIYSSLWGVHSFLPVEQMAEEYWQWLFVGPILGFAGALAAFTSLDFDWGTAFAHFSLYVIFTASLRWILGFPAF